MVNNQLSWEQGEDLPGHAGPCIKLGNMGPGKKHTPNPSRQRTISLREPRGKLDLCLSIAVEMLYLLPGPLCVSSDKRRLLNRS